MLFIFLKINIMPINFLYGETTAQSQQKMTLKQSHWMLL